MLSKEELLRRGADTLSRAYEAWIPIAKIDGLEPVPAASDEEGYWKGRPIKQPIEVTFSRDTGLYTLYAGNHRVTQAKLNGDAYIRAFVEPDGRLIGSGARDAAPSTRDRKANPPANVRLFGRSFGVDDKLGSGGYGTAWSTDRGDVIKVTEDQNEIALVQAAIQDGVFDGFVRVFEPPTSHGRHKWAYAREAIEPVYDPLLDFNLYTEDEALDTDRLQRLRAAAPGIADFIGRLYRRGFLVVDLPENVGRRSDGSLVLYDGQLVRGGQAPWSGRDANPIVSLDTSRRGWPGLSRGHALSEFDPKQLTAGISVEHEHIPNDAVAKRIAADHLTEDPRYYTRLRRMEKQAEEHPRLAPRVRKANPSLRLYHGTRHADAQSLRASTGGEFGPGVYLTAFRPTAEFYAERVASGPDEPTVLVVDAHLKNPVRIAKVDWIRKTQSRTPRTVQAALMRAGHDGIIGVGINGVDEQIVVFDPHQVSIVSREPARLDQRAPNPTSKLSKLPPAGPWYAGHQKFEKLSSEHVGSGNDQLGPGFYFTSSRKTARGYGPVIVTAAIAWKKTIDPYVTIPPGLLDALLALPAPQWEEENDTNWGLRDGAAARSQLKSTWSRFTLSEVLSQLQGTLLWYGRRPSRMLDVLVRAGYTGFVVGAGSTHREAYAGRDGETWAVVWDLDAITVKEIQS